MTSARQLSLQFLWSTKHGRFFASTSEEGGNDDGSRQGEQKGYKVTKGAKAKAARANGNDLVVVHKVLLFVLEDIVKIRCSAAIFVCVCI